MEAWELKQMQSLPLEIKILKTQQRIREWYEAWEGQVYVSFSGGKDSTVLLKLVRDLYPDVPAVFVDTGLEYPEIRKFVKTIDNVIWLKPSMQFKDVIKDGGFPVISKDVARVLRYAKTGSPWAKNKLLGINNDGTFSKFKQRYLKWAFLQDAPFNISDVCCELIKEKPMRDFGREGGLKPFIGLMAEDSTRRMQAYLITGCNAFDLKVPSSKPMGFWTEQDVLSYLVKFNQPYAEVYGQIIKTSKGLVTTGAHRTGCMFCMFGVHLEKGENRFQKMAKTHPRQYDYCINKLGLGEVLDYIGVDYRRNNLFG